MKLNEVRRRREESPGFMKTRCRITSGGREPMESATENKPLLKSIIYYQRLSVYRYDGFLKVRVKRCGKSAPRVW